jgi:hypothetical protein
MSDYETNAPVNSTEATEEELFADFEPDFDEGEFTEEQFNPESQIVIRYGTEEFVATVDGTKTLQQIVQEYRGSIGVSDVSRLNFKIQTTYVSKDYIPKAGELVTASASADTKGA